MGLFQKLVTVVALAGCGVVWNDAQADGWASGQGGQCGGNYASVGAAEGACTYGGGPWTLVPGPGGSGENAGMHAFVSVYASCQGGGVPTENGCGGAAVIGYECDAGYQWNKSLSSPACVPGTCQASPGTFYQTVMTGFETPDSTSCQSNCQTHAESRLQLNVFANGGVGPGSGGLEGWKVDDDGTGHGITCSGTTQGNPATSLDCTTVNGESACGDLKNGTVVGDAQDVVKNGTDIGASAVPYSALESGDGCATLVSGAIFCLSSAPSTSPPRPDDGTAGVPADKEGQITASGTACPGGGTCTIDTYTGAGSTYHPGSSSGGSGGPSSSGSSSGTGGGTGSSGGSSGSSSGGNGSCGASSSGSGSGASSGGCASGGDGGFSAPGIPGVKDFGQSLTDFQSSIAGSPIASSMRTLSDSVPSGGTLSGGCTTVAYLRSAQVCINFPQEMLDKLGFLRPLFLAMWALIAIILFFKA